MESPGAFDKKRNHLRSPSIRRACLCALAVASFASPGATAQAPDEAWRTLSTEHFDLTYPAELRGLATRAAARAERAYDGLTRAFDDPPAARIDIVVTDHVDQSNGFARVSPSNRITIFASPPLEGYELAYFDDWLELVITHELAHVYHLDRRGWLGDVVGAVFGRPPIRWPVFPNSALPTWIVEGLATFYESDLTDAGRTDGSYHDMVLRTAVLEGHFESLDQVAGESQVWPAGNRPYIYGSRFFDYLVEEHGREHMAGFAEEVDGQIIPFRPNAAARGSFGVTFKDAFRSWRRELEASTRDLVERLERRAPLTDLEPVASDGRRVLSPRVSPDGRWVAYGRSDGKSDVQIRLVGTRTGESRKLTRTNGTALLDWTPDGRVLFSQVEFQDPYRRYDDLYLADLDGSVRRVTHGSRLDYPSVSPDGRTAVAVQQEAGRTWLVSVDLVTGRIRALVEPSEGALWSYPRWSPDGRWIAATRWEPGAYYDLVLLDSDGAVVAKVTDDRAVDLAPTWSPDGDWLLWSSDRTGIPNIFAVAVGRGGVLGPVRQVTNVTTGVSYPAVGPEGRHLYLTTYHADGWHLERTGFDPAGWFEPMPTWERFRTGGEGASSAFTDSIAASERPYRAIHSLLPRYWEPTYVEGESRFGTQVIGPAIGLQTTGLDLVGRHAVGLTLRYEPKGGRWTGGLGYTFAGLGNPLVNLAAEQSYTSSGTVVEDTGEDGEPVDRTLFIVERERQLGSSVRFDRVRVRDRISLTVGASYVWESRELLDADLEPETVRTLILPTSGLPQLSATVGFNTSRFHPFSISAEDGARGFVRARRRWDATVPDTLAGQLGFDRTLNEVTAQLRLFQGVPVWGFANHVLALRGSAGVAGSTGADQFHFSVGGASGQGERITGLELLRGSSLLFPVRGHPRGVRSGRYAWTASAEWRFPIARINRGLGDLPLFFDWTSGTLFVDAGNAWGPELGVGGFQNPARDAVASAGAEILLQGLPIWTVSTVLRTGLAVPVSPAGDPQVYVRLGLSF